MALSLTLPICSILLLISYTTTAHNSHGSTNLVRSSCNGATYPTLCFKTLSAYPHPPAQTLPDLAQAAVKVSLYRALKASAYLAHLGQTKRGRQTKRLAAIKDCKEQISYALLQLKDTSRELKRLKTGSSKRRIMSNVKTWASAALTCQITCLDGIRDVAAVIDGGGHGGKVVVRDDLRRRIRNLSKVTSNALYLINLLDFTLGKGKA